MSPSRIRCVVFDIDDTLYLERDYARSGFQSVGEWVRTNLGIPDFADLAWRALEDGVRGSVFDVVLKERGVEPTPEVVGRLVAVYRTHDPSIELTPDARYCLDALSERHAMAVVTDGPIDSQRAKARALHLDRWIDPILFTAELGPDYVKPLPRGFQMVEEVTGCSAGECVYVADNPSKDFTGPKSLGWRTIRVRRREGLHYAIEADADIDLEMLDLWHLSDVLHRFSEVWNGRPV